MGFTIDGKHNCLNYVGDYQIQTAKSICANVGAKVPLPRNGNENKDYRAAFNSLGGKQRVALGADDLVSEGKWRDVNGNVSYTNWDSGQPNSWGNQDYVEMISDGDWGDADSTSVRSIICEI